VRKPAAICVFAFVIALSFAGVTAAENFCMDCTHRLVERGNDVVQEAECCNLFQGHCYERDWTVDTDVGYGCQVSRS